jgi:hypothetical protein
MAGVGDFATGVVGLYTGFLDILPPWMKVFINLLLLVIVVVLYAIFFWKLYRFVSKKNILELNLNQYNKFAHPFIAKIIAGALYFIEYILIMPFLIFFWFAIFTIFLILLTDGIEVSTLLIASAVIVGAARMTSYYKEDIAREISKLFPLTLLAVSMTRPGFFNFERILGRISQIPDFSINIFYYLLFIISLEIILRAFDLIFSLFHIEDLDDDEELEELPPPKNRDN